uniref:Uncharacterized protein n=1 Tax=viral metagenome TaxID=1070528 RepID=A0A6M3LBB2_9ZZZZ
MPTIHRKLQVGDEIRFDHSALTFKRNGVSKITKITNYQKGQRIYFESEYGYGFMAWENNVPAYELVNHN